METFKILNPGLLTTVQDLGRYGFQRYGVSASGVMDDFSAKVANKLVNNNENDAVLETTLKGVELEFLKDTIFAITGGDCQSTLNGKNIDLWKSYKATKGDILKIGICKSGLRNYLAFSGGIDVPLIMNSRSTNLKAKVGGYSGRKLMGGDILKVFSSDNSSTLEFNRNLIPSYQKALEIKIILGQQSDEFTDEGINTFFNETYTISQESDRMGIRLASDSGATIKHKVSADIISDGITFGAIQVPGSGQPIIMMADRQTTGGYTKIGNVISNDLSKLAQATPGTKIKFINYNLNDAINEIKNTENIINNPNSYIQELNSSENFIKKFYKIKLNGKIFDLSLERIE